MDYGKEFKKYAIQEHGINSLYYDQLVSSMTPYIIEERQMNVAQMAVFSRLMMDRIIFLGTRTIVTIIVIKTQQFTNFHFNKLKELLVVNHVSFV